MEDVARQLLFEGEQALLLQQQQHQQREQGGLLAELNALQLEAILHAEALEDPSTGAVLGPAHDECADLAARAHASAEAAADRCGAAAALLRYACALHGVCVPTMGCMQ